MEWVYVYLTVINNVPILKALPSNIDLDKLLPAVVEAVHPTMFAVARGRQSAPSAWQAALSSIGAIIEFAA